MALTPAQQIAQQRETGGGVSSVYPPSVVREQPSYIQQQPTTQPQPSQPTVVLTREEKRLIADNYINIRQIDRKSTMRKLTRVGFSEERAREIIAANRPQSRVYGATRTEQQQIELVSKGLTPSEAKEVVATSQISYEQAAKLPAQYRQSLGISFPVTSGFGQPAPEVETSSVPEGYVQTSIGILKSTNLGLLDTSTGTYYNEKTGVPMGTTYPTYFKGEGYQEISPNAPAPPFSIWSTVQYPARKLDVLLSKYAPSVLEASYQFEAANPLTSTIVRGTGRVVEGAVPFILLAPALKTGGKVTPIKPKEPQVISQTSRVAPRSVTWEGIRGAEYQAETVVKIPRTYVRAEGAFSLPTRVQVSPTIIMRTSLRAPITKVSETSLLIRGAIREQRILPTTTKFTGFRGYDVTRKMFIEKITSFGEITPEITRAKVSTIVVPLSSEIRVLDGGNKLWIREAGKYGGKSILFTPETTTIKIPTPTIKGVISRAQMFGTNVPYSTTKVVETPFAENLLGFESISTRQPTTSVLRVLQPSYTINTPVGQVLQRRYSQLSIQGVPFVKGVKKSTLDILTKIPRGEGITRIIPKTSAFRTSSMMGLETPQIQATKQLTQFIQAPEVSASTGLSVIQTETPKTILSTATSGAVTIGKIQSPAQSLKPIEIFKDIQSPAPAQVPRESISQTNLPAMKYSPRTSQVQSPLQTQVQVEQLITPTPVPKPRIPKEPLFPRIPFEPKLPQSSPETKRRRTELLSKAYRTFVYRGGQKKYLSGIAPRKEAILKGEKITLGTLAARFGIEETKIGIKVPQETRYTPSSRLFRGYKIKGKSRIPLEDEWIQKKGTRLGTRGEVSEIMSFKRKKGGNFFGL